MAATATMTGALLGAEGVQAEAPAGTRIRTTRPGAALVAFLLAAIAYAAFAQGATSLGDLARLQVALALAVTIAAGVWLWHGALPLRAPRLAWAGLAMLGAFAIWCGITLAWSITPDRTWLELNRAIAYVLVGLLGIAAASWWARAAERLAVGYLAVALAVGLYALGGKVVPGLHVDGIIDLNHTATLPRLRAPLDYWNALALTQLMAAPIALAIAVDRARGTLPRLAGLASLHLLLVVVGLTYSRGGVLALIVALGVFAWLSRERLSSLLMIAMALVAALPALVYAWSAHAVTALAQPLSAREHDGVVLAIVLLLSLAALVTGGRRVLELEQSVHVTPLQARRIGVALLAALGVALLGTAVATAASERGLTGTVTHEWKTFRTPRYDPILDPAHLITTNSGNRWVWWKEAAGAWSDRPLQGWGAGSFPVLHKQYRKDLLSVLQPHSVPLQLLAETGLIGTALALGGLIALTIVGVGTVRRRTRGTPAAPRDGPPRIVAAALAAAAVAWLVHGLYDWDLDIPGATIPALAFLGVLAGRANTTGGSPIIAPWLRAAALGSAALAMCAVAMSAILPAWADSKASSALALAGGRSPTASDRRRAAARAELAARLDPLSTRPLLALAAIDESRGRLLDARAALLRALRRQPDEQFMWLELARLDLQRGDPRAVSAAIARVLELDPHNSVARALANLTIAQETLPNDSATATGTPLPQASPAITGSRSIVPGASGTAGASAGAGP